MAQVIEITLTEEQRQEFEAIVARRRGVVDMKLTKNTKQTRPTGEDPRVATLVKALRSDPALAPIIDAFEESKKVATVKKFGSNGLKVNGKLFALFTQGTLVVKLPKERVAALVAARVGKNFDPGHGRLMLEWLTITSTKASWVDLAKDAHDFVKGVSRTVRRVRRTRST
jgi:TfoX/Sxy family transcriptional regulator of competence genes